MSNIELLYFPIHGRALTIRMLLKIGNVEFTDTKLSQEEFAKLKPELPLGQVPVLKVDGAQYCQTAAIVNYAAKLAKLPKLSDMEQLRNKMVCEVLQEAGDQMAMPAMMAMKAIPEDQKEKRSEAWYGGVRAAAPAQLAKLEKILKHIKAVDSVIPNKLSLADVTIINTYVYFCDAKTNGEEIFKQNCPTAFKIVEAVMKDDKIAAMVNEAKKVPYLPW